VLREDNESRRANIVMDVGDKWGKWEVTNGVNVPHPLFRLGRFALFGTDVSFGRKGKKSKISIYAESGAYGVIRTKDSGRMILSAGGGRAATENTVEISADLQIKRLRASDGSDYVCVDNKGFIFASDNPC